MDYVTNEKGLVLRIAKRKVARYYSLLERLRIFVSLNHAISENEDGETLDLSNFEADTFITEDFAINQVLLESARKLIHSRPEDVQKVFYLTYDIGLTISEIAEAPSMSESNVKNKLYRTL